MQWNKNQVDKQLMQDSSNPTNLVLDDIKKMKKIKLNRKVKKWKVK